MKCVRPFLLVHLLLQAFSSYGQNTARHNGLSTQPPPAGNKASFIQISPKDPAYFATTDGKTWIPVMMNFIVPDGEEEKVFSTVETYFRRFSSNGGNALRIWISSPFLEIEDQQPGKYNPQKFQRIDRLLLLAKRYHIRIKFTLQNFWMIADSPVGWWKNNRLLSLGSGGPFKDIHEYIGSKRGRAAYLARVSALAEKYKDNPQIFSWELWNEMESVGGDDWFSFTATMLDSVKALFPHHLIVQTLGSLHSLTQESNYSKLITLKNDAYLTIHRYLDPGTAWGQYRFVQMPSDSLIATAVDFVKAKGAHKPVVFNEVGAVAANHSGPSPLYAADTAGVLIHDMIFTPFFCGAAGSGALWHWDAYVDKQQLWYHFRRFANLVHGLDPAAQKMVPFSFRKDSVDCYGLKGETTTLIWCRDGRNNWKTELVYHQKPLPKDHFILKTPSILGGQYKKAQAYDPWTDRWSDMPVEKDAVVLPRFTRSIVVLLKTR